MNTLRNSILDLLSAVEKRGKHTLVLGWNWTALKNVALDSEITARIHAVEPLLGIVRKTYPRAYVLTNDEEFVPEKPHRHLEGIAGNLDPHVLSENDFQIVQLEYGWGRIDLGPNRWSYLVDLRGSNLTRFARELLGMSMNPISYNFLFARSSIEMGQLVQAMARPEDDPLELAADLWERRLLTMAGVILYPKEETYLVITTSDANIASGIRDAVHRNH